MNAKTLLGRAADPIFRKSVLEKDCFAVYRAELADLWDRYADENHPIPALTWSQYKEFFVSGDRKKYETPYFARRYALNASAILAMIYPEEERYLLRLMDEIFAICDEYSWCLPAHEGQITHNDNTKIDLFASETGFTLSEIDAMLGDRLDPLIRNRIRAEVDRRIFRPYLSRERYNTWEFGKDNWTSVCIGSVAGAFLYLRPDAEALLPRFMKSMDSYLDGYPDDGICPEGCGYRNYGFGFFTVWADLIRRFTDGTVDYFKRDKVRRIATFQQKMYLSGITGVSFADGQCGKYHLGLMHYLKQEYPNDIQVPDPALSYNYDNAARFCLQLRSAIWLNEEIYTHPDAERTDAVFFAPVSGWFIRRNAQYGFAAKSGTNNEPHNHNDVGSFIYAKNGKQDLTDPGPGAYTRQYFSGTRYEITECSSRGHSVPVIAGAYQKFGSAYRSADTRYENGVFSADLAGAYGNPNLTSLIRMFRCSDDRVEMTDRYTYTGCGTLTERLVSFEKPEQIGENRIRIGDTVVTFDPSQCAYALHSEACAHGTLYQMDFTLGDGVRSFSITMQ